MLNTEGAPHLTNANRFHALQVAFMVGDPIDKKEASALLESVEDILGNMFFANGHEPSEDEMAMVDWLTSIINDPPENIVLVEE